MTNWADERGQEYTVCEDCHRVLLLEHGPVCPECLRIREQTQPRPQRHRKDEE